jgi:hypothetical protein
MQVLREQVETLQSPQEEMLWVGLMEGSEVHLRPANWGKNSLG